LNVSPFLNVYDVLSVPSAFTVVLPPSAWAVFSAAANSWEPFTASELVADTSPFARLLIVTAGAVGSPPSVIFVCVVSSY
jgi:hypothetical protein